MKNFDMAQWLFLVFFIYGLSLFGMGVAMALESSRRLALAEAKVLRPLAAFGVLHGMHEWFESYLLQSQAVGLPFADWVSWINLFLLMVSFSCLLWFAHNLLQLALTHTTLLFRLIMGGLAVYGLFIIGSALFAYKTSPPPSTSLLDGLARYLLAMPASLLSAIAFHARGRQVRAENRPTLERYFYVVALGFGIYALTQWYVHPLQMFPASLINEESFLQLTGIPIQVIRTLLAVLIALSLLKATLAVEEERNLQLFTMQQARLQALQQQDELRRDLLRHTVQAQEDERSRVARELHDETAQILSAVSLHLATLRTSLKKKPDLDKVEQLQDLTRQMSHSLYRLVRDLRPAHLDDLGLIPALDFLVTETRTSHNIEINLTVEGTTRRLDLSIETILFRISQEAVNNIVKHARTCYAEVCLLFGEDYVHLMVADEGQGFDTEIPLHAPHGWGLEGMRERVESAGGMFQIKSIIGQGTQVDARIPLQENSWKLH